MFGTRMNEVKTLQGRLAAASVRRFPAVPAVCAPAVRFSVPEAFAARSLTLPKDHAEWPKNEFCGAFYNREYRQIGDKDSLRQAGHSLEDRLQENRAAAGSLREYLYTYSSSCERPPEEGGAKIFD